MQQVSPDPLTNFESERIAADFRALVDESQVNVNVTYRHLSSATFDAETGAETTTEDTDTVNALVSTVDADKQQVLGGDVEVGDRMYLIDEDDLTSTALTTEDEIDEGGVTRQVVSFHELQLVPGLAVVAREV